VSPKVLDCVQRNNREKKLSKRKVLITHFESLVNSGFCVVKNFDFYYTLLRMVKKKSRGINYSQTNQANVLIPSCVHEYAAA
jgi:hypothetical protein